MTSTHRGSGGLVRDDQVEGPHVFIVEPLIRGKEEDMGSMNLGRYKISVEGKTLSFGLSTYYFTSSTSWNKAMLVLMSIQRSFMSYLCELE